MVDMITNFFRDLADHQLEAVLKFAHKLNDEQESKVNELVREKLSRVDCLWPLKVKIENQLATGKWRRKLGERQEEKIVLIILISTIHYSQFILLFVRFKRNKVYNGNLRILS